MKGKDAAKALAVVSVVIVLILGIWWIVPKRKRGHYETVHVPGGTELKPGFSSNGDMTWTPVYVPAHTKQVWVCDEWEE